MVSHNAPPPEANPTAAPAPTRETLLALGVHGSPERMGGRCVVEAPVNIENVILGGETRIGAHTYFNYQCEMYDASIGRYCSVGQQVIINPGEHPIEFLTTHPIASDSSGVSVGAMGASADYQAIACTAVTAPRREQKPVVVGHDVWIGARAIITSGVQVGTGAVIGANSLVREDVEPYTIVAGSPARVIRRRFDEVLTERLLASEWWTYDLSLFADRDYSDIPAFLDKLEAAKTSGEARLRAFPTVVVDSGAIRAAARSGLAARAAALPSQIRRRLARWMR